jgi:hypothetical protein
LHRTASAGVARKLLVVVWHVLHEEVADRNADPHTVAVSFLDYAYQLGVKKHLKGKSALAFTREQLDRLGIGQELETVRWGSNHCKLPPSRLLPQKE